MPTIQWASEVFLPLEGEETVHKDFGDAEQKFWVEQSEKNRRQTADDWSTGQCSRLSLGRKPTAADKHRRGHENRGTTSA